MVMLQRYRSHEHQERNEPVRLESLHRPVYRSRDMEAGGTVRQKLNLEPVLEVITGGWEGVALAFLPAH